MLLLGDKCVTEHSLQAGSGVQHNQQGKLTGREHFFLVFTVCYYTSRVGYRFILYQSSLVSLPKSKSFNHYSCRYQLLHSKVLSTVLVIETPERVGTLLDYQRGRLSFYNSQSGQLLGSFSQLFPRPCHPALALELPGSLELCVVQERPEFTKDS